MGKAMGLPAAAALLLAAGPGAAHDFWIMPGAFRPEVGATVAVSLRVGQQFSGEPVLGERRQLERFFAVGPTRETLVTVRPGNEPAGLLRVESPGLWIIGYRSRPSPISLTAEQFERYLAEEGLERIIDIRAARGETGLVAREIFSRCAKSLVSAGPGPEGHDRQLGLTLELVAEENPYALEPGQELAVRLLYEGEPLPDALVVALNSEEPEKRLAARSDSEGRAAFRIGRAGPWLIKAVHMIRAENDPLADWQSSWASLTFSLPER